VAYAISFAMLAPFLAIFAFDIVSSPAVPRVGEHLIPLLLVHCSRTLPGNLAVAAAITAIPVLAAYLFAEQMAAQVELGSAAVTAA
jgi:hypothetical protein